MKIGKKYYYIQKSEFYGFYGFFIILPLVLKYIYLHPNMSFLNFLKIAITQPINWIIFIVVSWIAIKNFIHEYEPRQK